MCLHVYIFLFELSVVPGYLIHNDWNCKMFSNGKLELTPQHRKACSLPLQTQNSCISYQRDMLLNRMQSCSLCRSSRSSTLQLSWCIPRDHKLGQGQMLLEAPEPGRVLENRGVGIIRRGWKNPAGIRSPCERRWKKTHRESGWKE
jgi:hypothetical protein